MGGRTRVAGVCPLDGAGYALLLRANGKWPLSFRTCLYLLGAWLPSLVLLLGFSSRVVSLDDGRALVSRRNGAIRFNRMPAPTVWVRTPANSKPNGTISQTLTLLNGVCAFLAFDDVNDRRSTEKWARHETSAGVGCDAKRDVSRRVCRMSWMARDVPVTSMLQICRPIVGLPAGA